MTPPTDEQLAVLLQQDYNTLADWCCMLNGWKWPDELPDPEKNPRYARDSNRGHVIRWIKKMVGDRLVNWRHNRHTMSFDDWLDFWRGNYEGDAEALKRYNQRLWHKCHMESKK